MATVALTNAERKQLVALIAERGGVETPLGRVKPPKPPARRPVKRAVPEVKSDPPADAKPSTRAAPAETKPPARTTPAETKLPPRTAAVEEQIQSPKTLTQPPVKQVGPQVKGDPPAGAVQAAGVCPPAA